LTGWQEPGLRWRAQLIVNKSLGSLSGVPWSHVFAGILPHRVRDRLRFEALRVSAEKSGPGPCSVLWRTRLGGFWGRPGDGHSLEMALKYRLYDEFYLRGEASLRKGDTVIDAGAHLGTFTAFALEQGARRVILFEPDPVNAACLRQTFFADTDSGRVVILEEAVWHEPGVLRFQESSDSLLGRVSNAPQPAAGEKREIAVPATTIDDAVERLELGQVEVIKLNVEGAERNAVRGARQTIRRFRPRIVVSLEHHSDDAEVIPALIQSVAPGYRILWRGREEAFLYYSGR
jgi:FkbM family methyltransferase